MITIKLISISNLKDTNHSFLIMSVQYIINPNTMRKIQVGGKVWKKLTDEERLLGYDIYEAKTEKVVVKKTEKVVVKKSNPRKLKSITIDEDIVVENVEQDVCFICTESVCSKGNTTKCCNQTLCVSCFYKMNVHTCPYCRSENPLVLSAEALKNKRIRILEEEKQVNRSLYQSDINYARLLNRQSLHNERSRLEQQIREHSSREIMNVNTILNLVYRLQELQERN
jgi:hypothetical protein